MLLRQRAEQEADVGDRICHVVSAKDVALDDAGLPGLRNVAHALGENGVTVIGAAILGQEAD